MGFRFRRRQQATPDGDATVLADVLERARTTWNCPAGELDLAAACEDLIESGATADLRKLADAGTDPREFYDRELRPNWEGLSQGERASKIAAFARFGNVLGDDDAAGLAPLVRTKLLILAWAFDCTYTADMLPSVSGDPERFGRLEPVA